MNNKFNQFSPSLSIIHSNASAVVLKILGAEHSLKEDKYL